MFTNKYPGKCQSCENKMAPGVGFVYRNGNRWLQVCTSAACFRRLGLKEPQIQAVDQRRYLTQEGTIHMPYDSSAITLLRAMPGARWNPTNKCWTVSTKPSDLPRVIEIADQLKLEVPELLRDQASQGTVNSREAKERASKQGLYPFQRVGVEFLALKDRALLADEQGLGKSIECLAALPNDATVLILCPSALKFNWQDEANKWRPEFKTTVLSGRNSFRFPEAREIVIANYDILPEWMSNELSKDIKDKLSNLYLIADEAQLLKNYKTKRSKNVSGISKHCKSVWLVTGTPLANRPTDLYGVLCSGNMNCLGVWTKFVKLFNGFKDNYAWRFGDPTPEVGERLKRIMIRRLKKDVLTDLPDKTYQTITVDKLSKELKIELDAAWNHWDDEQPYGGLPSFEAFAALRAKLATDRIPAMLEFVEAYEESDSPLVVFSAHKAPILELEKREGWAIITGDTDSLERRNIVKSFQAGCLKGVGLTIQAGGVGLTLTRASTALFVDRDWTPAWNIQAEDRIHRISQVNKVLIMHMRSNHALDLHVDALIARKLELIRKTLEEKYEYNAPKIKPYTGQSLVDESDDELKGRLSAIQEAEKQAEQSLARSKVARILEREKSKATLPEPELTTKRKQLLEEALHYMLIRCDGAFQRDGMGFNKPDAGLAHMIGTTGLDNDDDVTYRVLERILSRYYRQLGHKYEAIWNPDL